MRTNYDCPVCQTNFAYTQEELDKLERERQQIVKDIDNEFAKMMDDIIYRETIDYEIEQIKRFYITVDTPETHTNINIINEIMTACFDNNTPLLRKIAEEYPTTSDQAYESDLRMALLNLVAKLEKKNAM